MLSPADLDFKIIQLVEKFCHWFQRLTGKTNYWLAQKVFIAACMASSLAMVITLSNAKNLATLIWSFILIIWATYIWRSALNLATKIMAHWKDEEQMAYIRLAKGLSNPCKLNPHIIDIRLVFLATTLIILILDSVTMSPSFVTIFLFLLSFGLYLISCDPLPPAPEKKEVPVDSNLNTAHT